MGWMGSSAKAMHCGSLGILDIYSSMHNHLSSYEVDSEVKNTQVLSGLITFFPLLPCTKMHWEQEMLK